MRNQATHRRFRVLRRSPTHVRHPVVDEATQIRNRRQPATGGGFTLLPILRTRILARKCHAFHMPHAHTTVRVSNHTPPLLFPRRVLLSTVSTTTIPRETPEGTSGTPGTPAKAHGARQSGQGREPGAPHQTKKVGWRTHNGDTPLHTPQPRKRLQPLVAVHPPTGP